jgi:hypothetical protein
VATGSATKPRKATTARKPAAKRAASANGNGNGNGNGHKVPELRGPEEFVLREPVDAPQAPAPEVLAEASLPVHPFGDRRVQVFRSSVGEMIVVPHISTVEVTELFLWENHKKNLDLMQQSWRWMDLAQIPDDIQRQVVALDGPDKKRFWEQWFAGFSQPPSGEPPGES